MNKAERKLWTRENFYTHRVYRYSIGYLEQYSETYKDERFEFADFRPDFIQKLSKQQKKIFKKWEKTLTEYHYVKCRLAFAEGENDYAYVRFRSSVHEPVDEFVDERFPYKLKENIYRHFRLSDLVRMNIYSAEQHLTVFLDDRMLDEFKCYVERFQDVADTIYYMVYLSAWEIMIRADGVTQSMLDIMKKHYENLGMERDELYGWDCDDIEVFPITIGNEKISMHYSPIL